MWCACFLHGYININVFPPSRCHGWVVLSVVKEESNRDLKTGAPYTICHKCFWHWTIPPTGNLHINVIESLARLQSMSGNNKAPPWAGRAHTPHLLVKALVVPSEMWCSTWYEGCACVLHQVYLDGSANGDLQPDAPAGVRLLRTKPKTFVVTDICCN